MASSVGDRNQFVLSALGDLPEGQGARLTRVDGAHLQRLPAEQRTLNGWKLVSVYKGSRRSLGVGTEKAEDKDLRGSLDAVWQRAKNSLPQGGHDLRIKLNTPTVIISYRDEGEQIHYLSNSSPELCDLIKKVRKLSSQVFPHIYFSTELGNRASLGGQSHLAISSSLWQRQHPTSLLDYLTSKKGLSFAPLHEALTRVEAGRAKAGFDRIIAAEHFLSIWGECLRDLACQYAEKSKKQGASKAEKQEGARQEQQIRALYKKLNTVDRYAIYSAVGFLSDTALSQGEEVGRLKQAETLSDIIHIALNQQLCPEEDTRRWHQRLVDHLAGSRDNEERKGLAPHMALYAKEVGDLLLHNPLEHLKRVEEEGRVVKGASFEEFVVHNMGNLSVDNFNVEEAIASLGLFLDAEVKTAVQQALTQTRHKARQALETIQTISPELPWEKRFQDIKNYRPPAPVAAPAAEEPPEEEEEFFDAPLAPPAAEEPPGD